MILTTIDWLIIVAYFIISFGIGIYLTKRAGKSTTDFFLGGRNLPWWIAGTSMVATTFAADTPLAVTELVAQKGISGNWLWWNMMFGGMLTVFFFSRLWRRANILTDAEFVSIRYDGAPANFLRGFRAIYIGIFMNAIVIAWVNLAMEKVLRVMFPEFTLFGASSFDILGMHFSAHLVLVAGLMVFVAIYSSLSGLLGVSITDAFQFIMAMAGSIALSYYAIQAVGGIDKLKLKLSETSWVFDFMPKISNNPIGETTGMLQMGFVAFFAYLGVQWWASWYPGAEPGGGGYIAQRMMSAKDEKHSFYATLWFNIAHYALRPWPWVIVALVALVLYPNEADKGATYVMMIRDLMPAGLLGLLIAAFIAAYMSTISTQSVWGASYIVNDFYMPFVKPEANQKHLVKVSRIVTFLLAIFSLMITTQMDNISSAWKFVLAASGGIGLVLILRWFWWRINAWSEIAAMVAPYFLLPILMYGFGLTLESDFEVILILVVNWSTIVWFVVTYLTKPTSMAKLKSFYKQVHPGGIGWKNIDEQMPEVEGDTGYPKLFVNWILGSFFVMFSLFGFGKLIFHEYSSALIYLGISAILVFIISRNIKSVKWG